MSANDPKAEPQMNATPLIDVLLVLLVMLIFTLPMATHAVKLNLPQGKPRVAVHDPEFIRLNVDFDGAIVWNEQRLASLAELESRLRNLESLEQQPAVNLSADARAAYEPVAQVLAATQRAHVRDLRIVNLAHD